MVKIKVIEKIPKVEVECVWVGVAEGFKSCFGLSDDDSTSSDSENLSDGSDAEDFDPTPFECGDITKEVEEFVEDGVEHCTPLTDVFGKTASETMKSTIRGATEETECVGMRVFSHLFDEIDVDVEKPRIQYCTEIAVWCCCETVKKVSPIIAGATLNLLE